MLFGIFYYLITDATNSPSLKSQSQTTLLGNNVQTEEPTNQAPTAVKGDSTETSVFKALSTQTAAIQPRMVLAGADEQTPESTVPDTGSETIFGAFVVSSLIMFTGIYLMISQPKNTALAKFEKRIIRELD
ncbi:MAG: hypothetical protein ABIH84_01850, partial [bacterium]